MKKTKKSLSLLITILFSVSMIVGCGSTDGKDSASSSTPTNNSTTASESTEAVKPGNPQLPIVTSPVTFKIWAATNTNITKTMKDLSESEYFKEMEKRTGVKAEFIHPAIGQEKEGLNLLLASGNLPDIIEMSKDGSDYPGGLDKGIADGVILKLNDLVDKYAPNYKAFIDSAPDIKKGSITDSGNIAAFYSTIPGETQPAWCGPVVRQDWLDELGLKAPVTYDDWYVMLKAFKEKKGAVAPMMLYNTGFQPFDMFTGGYGVGAKFYQVDGKVKYGPIEAGYKEYLEMMHKWYSEGLIDKDFATKKDFVPSGNFTTTGKTGAWYDIYVLLSVDKMRAADPKYNAVAVPSPVKKAGDQLHLRQTNVRVGNSYWVVTTSCKKQETAIKWIDYVYSPDGEMLANFGIEGKTYTKGTDGKPQFTELMYKNPDGLSLIEAMVKYAKGAGAKPYHWERELAGQPQGNIDALKIWCENNDGAYYIPPTTLTTDEGSEYAAIMGDIDTFVSEMNIKYIFGEEPLSKYDDFVKKLKDMNIDRAIELQQAALDRYNSRK